MWNSVCRIHCLATFIVMLTWHSIGAAPVVFKYMGHFTDPGYGYLSGRTGGAIALGAPFSGTLSYDTALQPTESEELYKVYAGNDSSINWTLTLGGMSLGEPNSTKLSTGVPPTRSGFTKVVFPDPRGGGGMGIGFRPSIKWSVGLPWRLNNSDIPENPGGRPKHDGFYFSYYTNFEPDFVYGKIDEYWRTSLPPVVFNQGAYAGIKYVPESIGYYAMSLPEDDPLRPVLNQLNNAGSINLAKKGCQITAFAMALRDLGVSTDITPEALYVTEGFTPIKKVLNRNAVLNGKTPVFDGANLEWGTMLSRYPTIKPSSLELATTGTALRDALRNGSVAIMQVRKGSHWVYVDGYDPELQKFSIVDPNGGALTGEHALNETVLGGVGRAIVLSLQDKPVKLATAGTKSPVDLLITNASGQRVGIDAAGVSYSEIAGASAMKMLPVGDPDEAYTDEEVDTYSQDAPTLIFLNDFSPGDYTIDLTGLGTGAYSVSFDWRGAAGSSGTFTHDGFITPGEQVSLDLNIPAVGDYNGDDVVDGADLLVWQQQVGTTTDITADGNVDGVVDALDLQIWEESFGQVIATPPLSTPEPKSLVMIAAILLPLAMCRGGGRI